MAGHRLQTLVAPASVAVVGATRREGLAGHEVLVNLRKGKFPGRLYAVNPGYDDIVGVACYPSLTDLPELPEHVIFALGDRHIEAALAQAITLGIPAATIYSSLMLPDDVEPPLMLRIRAMAQAAGLLLAGGNGMGIYNFRENFWSCGFATREHSAGNVVLLSQSGSGMSGILDCDERLNFLFAASTGQELVIGVEDYLDYVLELPETRVIGLFLETSRQPQKLMAAFARAAVKQIPIVVLKVGRSEFAAQLATSHSGALAGVDASYQAVFDRYGVQRVDDMDELATALIMFAQPFALPKAGAEQRRGEGIVSLHDSGGERQLILDLAQRSKVPFASLGEATRARLASLLDPGLPAVNPLDAWGAGGADADQVMADCLSAMLADDDALLGAVVHDRAPNSAIHAEYIEYMEQAHRASGKPVFLVAARQGTGQDARVLASTARGFPVLDGVSQFLVGARCLLNYRTFLATAASQPPILAPLVVDTLRSQLAQAQAAGSLGEFLSTALLSECGLIMNDSMFIHNAAELEPLLEQLLYPVVLKTAARGVAHKSDAGGVVLSLADAAALRGAYIEMAARLGPQALVAPMITGAGVEMLLGVSRDPQFGPMVVIGFGGIHAEVLQDVRVLLAPFGVAEARAALDQLRMRPLLDGVRGQPAVDIDGFCEMAARLSALAHAFASEIAEIDINPVRVGAWGAVGLDALVVCAAVAQEDSECPTLH